MSVEPGRRASLAFVGGTGPHGRGLALRFAAAGFPVVVGSRSAERAEETAREIRSRVPEAQVRGLANGDACAEAEVVFVTLPHEAQSEVLPGLASAVGSKVVVSCANPLVFDRQGPVPVATPEGSAAEEVAALLPEARVVGAFQNVSAVSLRALDEPLSGDVLLCGDDGAAKDAVAVLVAALPALRAVDAGPLRLSRVVEDLTAVLLSVNRRYRAHAGIQLTGVDPAGA